MRNSQQNNVDNFQRNARGGHLVFQNEANFSPREDYLPMKISCKFGAKFPTECVNVENLSTLGGGGGLANTKPKYPPDASGGYN